MEEEVAVKTISLCNASEEQERFANRELALMCIVSQKLSGHVVELKGFHMQPREELVIAMELATSSLHGWLRDLPGSCLPQDEWVRPLPKHVSLSSSTDSDLQTVLIRGGGSSNRYQRCGGRCR